MGVNFRSSFDATKFVAGAKQASFAVNQAVRSIRGEAPSCVTQLLDPWAFEIKLEGEYPIQVHPDRLHRVKTAAEVPDLDPRPDDYAHIFDTDSVFHFDHGAWGKVA